MREVACSGYSSLCNLPAELSFWTPNPDREFAVRSARKFGGTGLRGDCGVATMHETPAVFVIGP